MLPLLRDVVLFNMWTMHGSTDNNNKHGRVRLSVDVRYQPAALPFDDPRYFAPDLLGSVSLCVSFESAAQHS